MSLHIVCYCDFHRGSIVSLDVLITLLLDHQKLLRTLSWYGIGLSVPSSVGRLNIRPARSGQIQHLRISFQKESVPRAEEGNNYYLLGWSPDVM